MIQLTGDYDTDLKAAIDEGKKWAKAYEDLNYKYCEVMQGIINGSILIMPDGSEYKFFRSNGLKYLGKVKPKPWERSKLNLCQ